VPIVWNRASPALQASLAGPLAAQGDTVRQLRYRAVAGPARIPDPARRRERAAAVPSLMWPGWALRLLPPQGRGFQRSRALLAVMLAVAVTGEAYGTAARLLGLEPSRLGKLGNFTALLRQHGALEPVTAAICQLARSLDQHGAPVIDYARRRRQGSLCQAPLDTGSWRGQSDLLLAQHGRPATSGAPANEQFARLRLIELLTGTHPRYLPGPLQLPRQRGPDYAAFVFTMPGQLDLCLRRQASALLSQAGVSEPVTWEPPPGWVPGIPLPGPDPDAASAGQRIRRLLAIPGQPDLQHAARQLGTTTARLARQVRQLEDAAGTALLHTGPDGRLTLTAYGRLLARDDRPALETTTQPRERNPGHAP
jgi:Bacterial regulatory helix-turn-helix protein, lysR family